MAAIDPETGGSVALINPATGSPYGVTVAGSSVVTEELGLRPPRIPNVLPSVPDWVSPDELSKALRWYAERAHQVDRALIRWMSENQETLVALGCGGIAAATTAGTAAAQAAWACMWAVNLYSVAQAVDGVTIGRAQATADLGLVCFAVADRLTRLQTVGDACGQVLDTVAIGDLIVDFKCVLRSAITGRRADNAYLDPTSTKRG